MKRWVRLLVLATGLACLGSAALGDFYVIPAGKRQSAPVARTGQDSCYKAAAPWATCPCGTAGCPSGQDGDLKKGVAWPNPRFTDQGNGTVTDNLTGLVWTKNANCAGGQVNWSNALAHCNALASGQCGLSDGSTAGDWRLPNRFELGSLLDLRYVGPPVPNRAGTGQASEGDPFTGMVLNTYWSSSTTAFGSPTDVWSVYFNSGYVDYYGKVESHYAWCVR